MARSNVGVDAAVATIALAVQRALDAYFGGRIIQPIDQTSFSRIWIGLAGYDRPLVAPRIDAALSAMFQKPLGHDDMRVTSDIDLLPVALAEIKDKAMVRNAFVLVVGTGSVAMSYSRRDDGSFARTNRAGGWGHLLGDDGSGFSLGREALRVALADLDNRQPYKRPGNSTEVIPTETLTRRILEHLSLNNPGISADGLLSGVLVPDVQEHERSDATAETARRIAAISRIVIDASTECDTAKKIMDDGVQSLSGLLKSLCHGRGFDTADTGLVLAGGMMQNKVYREALMKQLHALGMGFCRVHMVCQPAEACATYLRSVLDQGRQGPWSGLIHNRQGVMM